MKYKPDIYKRKSIRLAGYDYSTPGAYFITICTHQRELLFGNVRNGKMELNEYGLIAHNEWMKTQEMRSNINLDAFVIMPNHVHGIIIIDDINDDGGKPDCCGGTDGYWETNGRGETDCHGETNGRRGTMHRAPTERNITTNTIQTIEQFGKPTSNTIPTIIRGYKSSVTKQIKILNENPQMRIWQRNYYEHIICDDIAYYHIREYIRNNPLKWIHDSNNPEFIREE